jgi:microcompartment protein CcmL/EutN
MEHPAVGMLEVEGIAGLIVAADAACKTADVRLLGWDSIGGFTTLFFSGSTADVEAGLQRGAVAARDVVEHVVAASMNRPEPDSLKHISVSIGSGEPVVPGALGLVETRGYGIQVTNADLMVKAAGVTVRNVLSVQNRVVCTVIDGEVSAVHEALATSRKHIADRESLLVATMISQPHVQVVTAFAGGEESA